MSQQLKPTYEIRAVHSGHTFINGKHWCARCALCCALLARADAIAKEESTNES